MMRIFAAFVLAVAGIAGLSFSFEAAASPDLPIEPQRPNVPVAQPLAPAPALPSSKDVAQPLAPAPALPSSKDVAQPLAPAPAPSLQRNVPLFPAPAPPLQKDAPGRLAYLPIVAREARERGLPVEVADAVVTIESGYRAHVVGGVGEVGLMQVRPSTAAMLGFRGTAAELADPETNVRYGVMYLARAWQLAKGDLCRALMKYRAGHGEETISPLSAEYCRRARVHLAAIGWAGGDQPDPGAEANRSAETPASRPFGPAPASVGNVVPTRPDRTAVSAADVTPTRRQKPALASAASLSGPVLRGARKEHPMLIESRARIAEALARVSARSRNRAFWAEHDVRTGSLRKRFAESRVETLTR